MGWNIANLLLNLFTKHFMLTGFQIRAARSGVSLYLKDVSNSLGIHTSTLTRLEAQTPNLSYISCNTRTSLLLKNFYESKGFFFPHYNSIGIDYRGQNSQLNSKISRFQFKISRIALRMTRKELGAILNISETTIAGWETTKDLLLRLTPQDNRALDAIKLFFDSKGIICRDFNVVEISEDTVVTNTK